MKKIIIAICSLAIIGFGVYYISISISRIGKADLDYNTVYSDQYEETAFDKIKIGMPKREVIKLLGKPINVLSPEFKHTLLFSEFDVSLNGGSNGVSHNDTSNNISFLRVDFESNGNVLKVFNKDLISDDKELEIFNYSYDQIIAEFGTPIDSFKCLPCLVLNYSRIKDGSYSGKAAQIHIRRIKLNSNQEVEKIIKTDGGHFSTYIGVCAED